MRIYPLFLSCSVAISFTYAAEELAPDFKQPHVHVENVAPGTRKPSPYVEVKTGYFFFTSSAMRNVYDHGGIDVQLSGAYPVAPFLSIYGSVEYLEKSGKSQNDGQHTSIWEMPISVGLQPSCLICAHPNIRYYATIGPRYIFVQVHNDSAYVSHHMHASGLGGFVNTGFLFDIFHGFTLDLFGEYSYKTLHFCSTHPATQGHRVQIGGLTFGGALGYTF